MMLVGDARATAGTSGSVGCGTNTASSEVLVGIYSSKEELISEELTSVEEERSMD